jgi:O-acetyl-ADP-ribose deacetylase
VTDYAVRLQLGKGKSFELHGPADITKVEIDAIVNAANSSLLGGGGVDGAIHRTGGPSILAECKRIVAEIGMLEHGKAVITTAGRLPAKYVIHTVGPIYRGGGRGEPKILKSCYEESIRIADEHDVRSIAFPSISTGAFGYPIDEAAPIAIETAVQYLNSSQNVNHVRFVLFDTYTLKAYVRAVEKLIKFDKIHPVDIHKVLS